MQEISNRTEPPYQWVALVISTFPDGYSVYGTGALVGRNDVLTATHVVFSPNHGGWAEMVEVYPGADYNDETGILEQAPYGSYKSDWIVAWPEQVFADADDSTMSATEIPYDIAIVGLMEAVGDRLGWFGLNSGYNTKQWVSQIGYPSGSPGMMYGSALVTHISDYETYFASGSEGSDMMGPGSSGGPLYVTSNNAPYIIGVKSAGSGEQSYWADIGFLFDYIVESIQTNDDLIGSVTITTTTGTDQRDRLYAKRGNDNIDGGAGLDTVVFSGNRANFSITHTGSALMVKDIAGSNGDDILKNVERLEFQDMSIAFDIDGNAGQIYRLYQAAFNRQPDKGGLGYWIHGMDQGMSLQEIAVGFIHSVEFSSRYGASPSTSELVGGFYQNVLHRAAEQGGYDYWADQLDQQLQNSAQVLVGFSESPENQAQVIGSITNGIEYMQYL